MPFYRWFRHLPQRWGTGVESFKAWIDPLRKPFAVLLIAFGLIALILPFAHRLDLILTHVLLCGALIFRSHQTQKEHATALLIDAVVPLFCYILGLVSLGVSAVGAYAAYKVLSRGLSPNLEIMSLLAMAIPATFLLLSSANGSDSEDEDETAHHQTPDDEEHDDSVLSAADTYSLTAIFYPVFSAVAMVLSIFGGLGFGFVWFTAILRSMREEQRSSWSVLVEATKSLGADFWIQGTAVLIVLGGMALSVSLFTALRNAYLSFTDKNATRDLSAKEEAFIDTAHLSLLAYIETLTSKGRTLLINLIAVGGFIGGMIVVFIIGAIAAAQLVEYLGDQRAPLAEWSYYSQNLTPMMLVGIFWVIFVLGVIASWLSSFFPDFEERYVIDEPQYGGGELERAEGFPSFRLTLAKRVRYRKLKPEEPFDPGALLRTIYHSYDPFFRIPSLILTIPLLVFGYLDINAYTLATPQKITTTHYWTGKKITWGYEDIQEVRIRCARPKDDLLLDYELVPRDGRAIDLLSGDNWIKQIDALEKIDERMVQQAVPFRSYTKANEIGVTSKTNKDLCKAALAEEYKGSQSRRIESLMHLDTLEIVEGPAP